MAETLVEKVCTPCRGGVPPLPRELADDARLLRRTFRLANFREALAFVHGLGELAEAEGHHPDLCFGWGYVTVALRTKKIKGLHENDFIMAAKVDRLSGEAVPSTDRGP